MAKITFKQKWFNPLYFILNKIQSDHSIRTVFVYGGKSSSKTVSVAQVLSKQAIVYGQSIIAYRKESASIDTTLKKSFNLAQDSMRIDNGFKRLDKEYRTAAGAEIVLKGIDNEEKAKGIESYTHLYLDELNHFTYQEYTQFQMSLRGIPGQKVWASWNPVDEDAWVKTHIDDVIEWTHTTEFGSLPCEHSFIKISADRKTVMIKTTYEDNYWIAGSPDGSYGYKDENLIAYYDGLAKSDYNAYKVNVLGLYGKTTYGGEFLKHWKSEHHVGLAPYNPKLALRLIFDENVNPYFPCALFQVEDDQKTAKLVHVVALSNPNNTTSAMIRELKRKLTEWQHKEALYIGGDATSQKEDVKQEKGHDLFHLIMVGLAEYKPRRIVGESNPSVIMSKDFVNSILESNIQGLSLLVDKSCRKAIADFENTKEDKNGKVDKSVVRDPVTKITYQPWGHFCDILRYFYVQTFAREYSIYQKGSALKTALIGKNTNKNEL